MNLMFPLLNLSVFFFHRLPGMLVAFGSSFG